MFTKILIPLDGSITAEAALPYARVLGESLQSPLELLAVVDISAATARVVGNKARYLSALIEEGERSNEKYLSQIAAKLGSVESRCLVARGQPAEVIVQHAATDKNILIAMAGHGRTGLSRWLLGSIAEKVLRSAKNPLLLVRARDGAREHSQVSLKSIIVPLDGSTLAESVLPGATTFAECFNLELVLFRAYELPASAYYGKEDHLPDYENMKKNVRAAAEQYLAAKVAVLKTRGLTRVRTALSEGPGAKEIIRYARDHADSMVAICTHGRSGVKRWLIGSVTEKVVRHSENPVLVIRAA
jgi:nucleotide-binding universal stress UspA family protein